MNFDDLAKTCELETKNRNGDVDNNLNLINEVANKVEAVISSKLEEFNKQVNPVETPPINNNGGEAAVNNDNAGDSTGNNDSANGSAEQE